MSKRDMSWLWAPALIVSGLGFPFFQQWAAQQDQQRLNRAVDQELVRVACADARRIDQAAAARARWVVWISAECE